MCVCVCVCVYVYKGMTRDTWRTAPGYQTLYKNGESACYAMGNLHTPVWGLLGTHHFLLLLVYQPSTPPVCAPPQGTSIDSHTHTHVHGRGTSTDAHTHTHIHTGHLTRRTHTHTHTYTHTSTDAHTHTRTHTPLPSPPALSPPPPSLNPFPPKKRRKPAGSWAQVDLLCWH